MQIEVFELKRVQSLWENRVEYNLTESGVHLLTLDELLDRQEVAALYAGSDSDNVLVTLHRS